MVEALGLAGMAEVPVVIVDVQRGGPSTGLPTRTEQADLLFAIHAGQGEFPRIVLAPGTVEQCFEAGWRAFNLADRYQCPVVVLSDLFLAGSLQTADPETLGFASVAIDRGSLLDGKAPDTLGEGYRRFAITPSGISPRRPRDDRAGCSRRQATNTPKRATSPRTCTLGVSRDDAQTHAQRGDGAARLDPPPNPLRSGLAEAHARLLGLDVRRGA